MSVPRLKSILVLAVVCTFAFTGGLPLGPLAAAGASSGSVIAGSQTSPPSTTDSSTSVEVSEPPSTSSVRSSTGTTRTVTRSLLGIAAATAVMALAYFWYTIPSRRERIAERRR